MSSKDRANLLAILDAIRKIESFTASIRSAAEFHNSEMAFDATLMDFVFIGEMVARISVELKAQHLEMDWQQIKDFRNLVAHDYLGIDAEEVWQIIQNDLPTLKKQLQQILHDLPSR
jgi:uncharacterized protein with HEPN domain